MLCVEDTPEMRRILHKLDPKNKTAFLETLLGFSHGLRTAQMTVLEKQLGPSKVSWVRAMRSGKGTIQEPL